MLRERLEGRGELASFILKRRDFSVECPDLLRTARIVHIEFREMALQHLDPRLQALEAPLHLRRALAGFHQSLRTLPQQNAPALPLGFQRRQFRRHRLLFFLDAGIRLFRRNESVQVLEVVEHHDPPGKIGDFGLVFLVKSRLSRLAAQRAEAGFLLAHDVGHAKQIRLRKLQFAQRLVSPALVLHDAGGFFNQNPPVHGPRVHERFYLALLHDGEGIERNAGIEKQIDDVLEAAGIAVDEVFAFPGAVQAAGDDHLVEILERRRGHDSLEVGDGKRDLGHAELLALGAAVEDDVLHLLRAHVLGRLLAQNPPDGVAHIALAAPVGPDHGRKTLADFDDGLLNERLEPLHLQALESQFNTSAGGRTSLSGGGVTLPGR